MNGFHFFRGLKALIGKGKTRWRGYKKLYFLGDSHVSTIRNAYLKGLFGKAKAKFTIVGGATAVGLRHPTSKTQALLVYKKNLIPFRPRVLPIFQLGEVDCGFVIWARAQKYGESVEDQVSQSIASYTNFLVELKEHGYKDIIVTSAVLPTILDGQLEGEVAHLRREVKASLKERTDLTIQYNSRLRQNVEDRGMIFIDLTPHLLDPQTGIIQEAFRHPDPADHHLNPITGGEVWAKIVEDIQRRLPVRI